MSYVLSLEIVPWYVTQSTTPHCDSALSHDACDLGFNYRFVTLLLVDGALDVILCYEILSMN